MELGARIKNNSLATPARAATPGGVGENLKTMKRDLRQMTRDNILSADEENPLTHENITDGCMLRIADAVEILTKDWSKMKIDLKWYQEA